ncbi:phage late control D family protein [Candidatus Chloroploca sp. Khr17]|uniref:phage late control D family protein n=1 Tax=Candidatus Chloroploca sp. Khr17 TaxID=2496869 RepID=UPI00101D8B75|nr:contractile injection system protein, VgrG/Pvc8 family [Candidatus Chloroploca sp. Khr17]
MTEAPPDLVYMRPSVRVAEQAYAKIEELLIGMTMTEQEGGLAALELRYSGKASDTEGDADYAFEDEEIYQLGAEILVGAGDVSAPEEIFRGVVTGFELSLPEDGPPELVVLAEDALMLARMTRKTRTFDEDEVTVKGLAEELADTLSLTPVIADGLETNIGTQVQLNESDLAFVRRICRRYDVDLQVVGTELHVSPRGAVRRGDPLTLTMYEALVQVSMLADLAHQVTEMTTSGWDALAGRKITGTASRLTATGPGSGTTGKDVLERIGRQRTHHIGHLAMATGDEAQAIAEAAFDQRARRFVCIEGTAVGEPKLRVGTHIDLVGVGPRFENTYYVTSACHRWDETRGYQVDFEAESAYWGGR